MPRPPKPSSLHELSGAWEKNPNRKRTNEPTPSEEPIVKPKLKGRAAKIWDEFAPICVAMKTLARGDEPEFATWCNLQAEYEKDPINFQSARLNIKRTAAERFGIAGAGSRAKLGVTNGSGKENQDPADKYFGASERPGNTLCN